MHILEFCCKLTLYMPCCIVIIASLHNWARNFDIITKMHIIPPSVITFWNFIEWYRDLPEHYRFQNYQYSWNVWSSLYKNWRWNHVVSVDSVLCCWMRRAIRAVATTPYLFTGFTLLPVQIWIPYQCSIKWPLDTHKERKTPDSEVFIQFHQS